MNETKKHICLLNDSFPPLIDGVANAVVNYASELTKKGNDAFVVTPEYPGADDSGFDFPVIRYPGLDMRGSVGYIAGIPFSPHVSAFAKAYKTDILHSHCPISSTILARAIRETLDVPLVMTYHTKFDIDIAKAVKNRLIKEGAISALVNSINLCDEVWVVSEGAGENLRSLGYAGDYIVMENGVDLPRKRLSPERSLELSSSYIFPEEVPVFLYVGRIMWYKGLRITVDALAALRSQGIDFRMVFVGNGTDREDLEAYIKKLGLDDRIFFTGAIYDREVLCAWYCRADLFLFPSSFDTNGLVVREAAACSLPSVLVKGSCAAEGVSDRHNGFLIDENAASLAVLLSRIAEDRPMLRKVGENAADELYISWSDAVDKASMRYEAVIENYKKGLYKKPFKPGNELMRFSGGLMELFAEAQKKRFSTDALFSKIVSRSDEESIDRYM